MSSVNPQRDYVAVVYNEEDRPFTQYPDKLARYLSSRYKLPKGIKVLDLGCGRGEFLRGFIRCGLNGYGVDQSVIAKSICPEAEILQSDLENKPLPYNDNSFDAIFSKSVLEHFIILKSWSWRYIASLNQVAWLLQWFPIGYLFIKHFMRTIPTEHHLLLRLLGIYSLYTVMMM